MTAEAVRRHLHVACTLALLVTVAAGCGSGRHDTIRIGIYGDCYGPFAGLGVTERAEAGADVSFIRRGAKPNGPRPSDGVSGITVAGKRVELVLGCDLYRSRTSSLGVARRLVEQQGADILVTPDDVPDDGVASLYSPPTAGRGVHLHRARPGGAPRPQRLPHRTRQPTGASGAGCLRLPHAWLANRGHRRRRRPARIRHIGRLHCGVLLARWHDRRPPTRVGDRHRLVTCRPADPARRRRRRTDDRPCEHERLLCQVRDAPLRRPAPGRHDW